MTPPHTPPVKHKHTRLTAALSPSLENAADVVAVLADTFDELTVSYAVVITVNRNEAIETRDQILEIVADETGSSDNVTVTADPEIDGI